MVFSPQYMLEKCCYYLGLWRLQYCQIKKLNYQIALQLILNLLGETVVKLDLAFYDPFIIG